MTAQSSPHTDDVLADSSLHHEIQPETSPQAVARARMLVSLLGADFAKENKHPFFKRLAQTAVAKTDDDVASSDMSVALQKLVKTLAAAEQHAKQHLSPAPKAPPASAVDKTEAPTPDTSMPQSHQEPAVTDISKQHPVLIAKHVIDMPSAQRVQFLRLLPGATARQVAGYVAELQAAQTT